LYTFTFNYHSISVVFSVVNKDWRNFQVLNKISTESWPWTLVLCILVTSLTSHVTSHEVIPSHPQLVSLCYPLLLHTTGLYLHREAEFEFSDFIPA
jgi:hypothetical protein